jgi:hydrogenase nickel incorporation protein HypA/HybF
MHELSLAERALAIALDHAERAGAPRVTAVNLVVGELSSVVDDCFRFYWEHVTQGTLAASSRLTFRRVPLQLRCRACYSAFHPAPEDWACPTCGAAAVDILHGEEFFLESIDVEKSVGNGETVDAATASDGRLPRPEAEC